MNNKKKQINVLLDKKEIELLQHQAEVTGYSKSAILRAAWRSTRSQQELESGKYERVKR
jgi:hypothetical protein